MASKKRKKGCLYGLVLALLVAAGVEAQSYPPELAGAMWDGQVGPLGAAIKVIDYQYVPWSIPGIFDYEWVGTFEGNPSYCLLDLDFFVKNGRVIGDAPDVWSNGRLFEWDPDMQAYARLAADPELPWLINFEVLTIDWDMDSAMYREGVFEYSGHPSPWWEISDDSPYWTYIVYPYDTRKMLVTSEE